MYKKIKAFKKLHKVAGTEQRYINHNIPTYLVVSVPAQQGITV